MNWNDLIGRQLGQYTIVEEIGRGGSSRVYRARDAEGPLEVALKVIPNDAEDRVGFVRRFEREVRAVAQLSHPNIVRVYHHDETDDLVYLAMQLVPGGTLRQRLGRPLPPSEAVPAIIQMAQALHHAHLRGIVHRDVKPSNMLVEPGDSQHLLLTDFGIAKVRGSRGITKTGTTIGTPEYMAPEQAEGKEIDQRADVYALGCVLYEALSGRPPFVGSTPVSVLYQQVHSRPAYIRGFNPDVPRDLAHAVELALAKQPEDRFPTAESFAQALSPFTSDPLPRQANSLPLGLPISRPLAGPGTGSIRPITSRPLAGPASVPMPRPAVPGSAPLPPSAEAGSAGLGQEGLDALFPDDTKPGYAPPSGLPAPGSAALPPLPRRPTSGPIKPTIPLPAFRLPAKQTRPLDLPLTPDGQLDLEAMMARMEGEQAPAAAQEQRPREVYPTYQPPSPDLDQAPMYVPGGTYAPPERARNSARLPSTGAPMGERGEPVTALRRALMRSGPTQQPRGPSEVWRPNPEELDAGARMPKHGKRRRRSPFVAGGVFVAVLALVAVAGLFVSTSGLGLTFASKPQATSTVAATPTPTVVPTATSTSVPPTATTNPQIALNKQAAGSFRSITLATFQDRSCAAGNNTAHFSSGQAIYVNLCSSGSPASGPMTVAIRQNGQVLFMLTSGVFVSPNESLWYARFGLGAGTYDMRVTININGRDAVAADPKFTVG